MKTKILNIICNILQSIINSIEKEEDNVFSNDDLKNIIIRLEQISNNKKLEYNIGDVVIDAKTNKNCKIIKKYHSITNPNQYYYFIRFDDGTGAYRNYKFLHHL